MPIGVYALANGGREEFRCAPGPAGWRWFSTVETPGSEAHHEVIDYAVDGAWRPVRIRIDTGSHALLLSASGERFVGASDAEGVDLPLPEDVDYRSPCFNAVTANRVRRTTDVQPLFIEPATLEHRLEAQRYELLGRERVSTPVGAFEAEAWRYTAIGTGWTARIWVAGDVVVSYEGLYELVEYEPGPRGPFPTAR